MDVDHLNELIELEDSYWWHQAKRELVLSILNRHFPAPDHILEGGIGSARNLLEFQKAGYEVTGLDIMPESVAHARERGLASVQQHDLTEPWPVANQSIGAVVLLDVIEHVPDPVAVLKHAAACLKPNGGIVVTVPAYPWLYGDWDKELGHYRRYTKQELRQHVREAGLQVNWLSHWNSFTLPAAIAVRSYQKCLPKDRPAEFPRVSSTANWMLGKFAAAERSVLERSTVPFGLSLVGVLTR